MEKKEEAIIRGKKIQSLRESKGISRRGLAKNIGISDTALANIENGNTGSITIELGKKICDSLNISFNGLFELGSSKECEHLKTEVERLKRENDLLYPYFYAYKAQHTISETMVLTVILRFEELLKKQNIKLKEPIDITSHQIRKEATEMLKKQHPGINFDHIMLMTLDEIQKFKDPK